MIKEKDINCIKSNPVVKQLIIIMTKSYNNIDNKLTESDCHDIVCYVLDHYSCPTLIHFLNEMPKYKNLTLESYDFDFDKYLELLHFALYDDIQNKLYEILDKKQLVIFDDIDNTEVKRYYNMTVTGYLDWDGMRLGCTNK